MNAHSEQDTFQQAGHVVGALIVNGGGEQLLIPEDELQRVDRLGKVNCQHCGELFEPRKASGGKPQKFCTPKCRMAAHAKADVGGNDFPPAADQAPATGDADASPERDDRDEPPDDRPFSWEADGVDVVIRHQPAVAVYHNPHGDIVIRQEGHYGPDEDQFVYIAPKNLLALIDKLCDIAGIPSAGK